MKTHEIIDENDYCFDDKRNQIINEKQNTN